MTKDTELTISVPEAGRRYFGLSRNAAYDAAKRGEIPTISVGPIAAGAGAGDGAEARQGRRKIGSRRIVRV